MSRCVKCGAIAIPFFELCSDCYDAMERYRRREEERQQELERQHYEEEQYEKHSN